ncbi:Longitudinals lacking protein, isoforms A/B/D/L [Papilio xuthus]|uniref:Longitudinals lacking protein, isoforms A/B/D/L n=1 Tax=Papilio xuthus TaxID=66420 RepID=A0A194Q9T5_PAPXU|nr:Longitudinals lacking protein, isoforms A/B/D/L [Papilio xuthus]
MLSGIEIQYLDKYRLIPLDIDKSKLMGDMVHYLAQLYSPYILGYGTAGLAGGCGAAGGGGKSRWTLHECGDCGNKYKHKGSLQRHMKYECRKQPSFKCPYCVYRAYQKHNLLLHERHLHKDLPEKVDFVSE